MTMRRTTTLLIVVSLLSSFVGRANAALPIPAGLSPGDQYHLVFVSSTAQTANFGPNGILDADVLVQGLADAAGIGVTEGVTWKAMLSDPGTSAISRFNPTAPIYNMSGARVAVSGSALWGTTSLNLENPIAFDETGAGSTSILIEVWTGTDPNGNFERADSNWMAAPSNMQATAGSSIAVNTDWINGGGQPSENVPLAVFAASDAITVPAIIPEPSTTALAMFGLLGLFARRRRA